MDTGILIDRHFELHDLIEAAWDTGDDERLENLCLEQIRNAPLISAALNGDDPQPLQAAGYNRLSSFYYQHRRWEDILRLNDEAENGGWNVEEMRNRVIVARRKLEASPPQKQ